MNAGHESGMERGVVGGGGGGGRAVERGGPGLLLGGQLRRLRAGSSEPLGGRHLGRIDGFRQQLVQRRA